MTPKRRVPSRSTSESSSGSSSDSSSSSSSSTGSGSGSSSSSDSDSSTSQEGSRPAQKQSGNETKKSAPVKPNQRKSTDSTTKSSASKSDDKNATKGSKHASNKTHKSKSMVYSSEDDDSSTKNMKPIPKRKVTAKPKNSATVTPKVPPSTKPLPTKAAKPATVNKNTSKTPPKSNDSKTSTKISDKSEKKAKKKSIFSPENSSESDSPTHSKLAAMKSQAKIVPTQKPRPKATPRVVEKPKSAEKIKPVVKEDKKSSSVVKSKPTVSSASSASSETSDSSSSSDSDSSADDSEAASSKNQKKSTPLKKVAQRPTSKSSSKENPASESDAESSSKSKTVTRKLTRSASTRKSKHLLGKNTFSDTDSDTESTKRSLSRSPVKRSTTSTKGKTKNSKRNDAKSRDSGSAVIEERKCPLENCDSVGHLGGRQDKHFTVEACPLYHNVSTGMCKDQCTDRKKRDDNRKKALEALKKSPKAAPTAEHKQFIQKIKDIRAKFKPDPSENDKDIIADKSREPDLSNVASDYDLKLFRDAQALGSEKIEDDLKTLPYTKGTKYIEMGKFEMEVWYQSPYPEDYARLPKLYLCEYCLRYMKSRTILQRHVTKCVWRHPPGEEVYRKDKICVWEVDGKRYKQYCQNLCLLAKFFLDHKTLYYDVEPFLFYVMTIVDSEGCHTVGYFSKEKTSFLNYNVSCILTLPPYQRQGYGRLLIDFSYLLTRVENKIGSPEKPLSDLGLISYRSYWKDVLLAYLCARPGTQLSIKDISQETAINSYDIVSTLQALGMMKYWKGKHIVLKKQDVLDEYVERMKRRGPLMKEVDRTCLRWTPFVVPQPTTV